MKVIRFASRLAHAEHYNDVIMIAMASQITSLTVVYSTVYSGADQRKHQSSASLAFVRGIHRWPGNSRHKGPVTRRIFPFHDVIMEFPGHVRPILKTTDLGGSHLKCKNNQICLNNCRNIIWKKKLYFICAKYKIRRCSIKEKRGVIKLDFELFCPLLHMKYSRDKINFGQKVQNSGSDISETWMKIIFFQ